jgi:hypothetical protein
MLSRSRIFPTPPFSDLHIWVENFLENTQKVLWRWGQEIIQMTKLGNFLSLESFRWPGDFISHKSFRWSGDNSADQARRCYIIRVILMTSSEGMIWCHWRSKHPLQIGRTPCLVEIKYTGPVVKARMSVHSAPHMEWRSGPKTLSKDVLSPAPPLSMSYHVTGIFFLACC